MMFTVAKNMSNNFQAMASLQHQWQKEDGDLEPDRSGAIHSAGRVPEQQDHLAEPGSGRQQQPGDRRHASQHARPGRRGRSAWRARGMRRRASSCRRAIRSSAAHGRVRSSAQLAANDPNVRGSGLRGSMARRLSPAAVRPIRSRRGSDSCIRPAVKGRRVSRT